MFKTFAKENNPLRELEVENKALRRHQADIVEESMQYKLQAEGLKESLRDKIAIGIIHGMDGVVRDMIKNYEEGTVGPEIVDFIAKAYDVADLALIIRKHKTEEVLKTFELWKANNMGMKFRDFLEKTLGPTED